MTGFRAVTKEKERHGSEQCRLTGVGNTISHTIEIYGWDFASAELNGSYNWEPVRRFHDRTGSTLVLCLASFRMCLNRPAGRSGLVRICLVTEGHIKQKQQEDQVNVEAKLYNLENAVEALKQWKKFWLEYIREKKLQLNVKEPWHMHSPTR
ncbi:hypothetical protein IEQ34_004189 [Dendrobium chrysotoxum]|uniref:Uncharacterized protein n=1 Tax=Dendrobium chrysotoxum TaxID=161865 RepID=A0AAV7HD70_DENCH|nr:hypothetical protein IEQ34_004189 [Dendrobium chrysotoxum]